MKEQANERRPIFVYWYKMKDNWLTNTSIFDGIGQDQGVVYAVLCDFCGKILSDKLQDLCIIDLMSTDLKWKKN